MWKQNMFTFAVYGIILFNAAMVLKHIYYKHTSVSLTCVKSDNNPGMSDEQCLSEFLSSHCVKRLLDDVDTSQGLAVGKQRDEKVYLSIGIVSTEGEENNLMRTLHSLTSHMSAAEYSDIVIVVVFEGDTNATILQRVRADFQNELDNGLIQVIYPTGKFLRKVSREPLGWRSRTFTDDFKKNTTDFNKRLSFLFEYCFRISKNCLHLTDQAGAIQPYFPVIKQVIDNLEAKNVSSYVHEFGTNSLPALGRLYSAKVLGDLAEYSALFTGGILPCEVIDFHTFLRPTLKISNQGSGQFLFAMTKELRGVKPEVEFKTRCKLEGPSHGLEKAFNEEEGFAWLQTPKVNDNFALEFKEPIHISRVFIATGSPLFRDMLTNGVLMACRTHTDTNTCDETQCTKIGDFQDPLLDARNVENVVNFPVKCLKVDITAEVKHWVIIREISIWPK